MKNSQKGSVLLIVILLLVLAGITVYFFVNKIQTNTVSIDTDTSSSSASLLNIGNFSKHTKSPFITLLHDSLFLAPNDGSLTMPQCVPEKDCGVSEDAIIPITISKMFYKYNPDKYDFIVILTNIDGPIDSNAFVKNKVQGIGRQIADDSSFFGSGGTLKSIITINGYNKYSTGDFGDLLHEISHQWLMWLPFSSPSINRGDGHWSHFIDTATRQNGQIYFSPNGGDPFIDNMNGTFSLDSVTPVPVTQYHKFNSMELYLMGLLPSSKVTPLTFWQSSSTQLSSVMTGTKGTLTVQNVIDLVGKRNPAFPSAQKNFKIAYILLPKKGEVMSNSDISNAKRFATEFPKEWSFATQGLSTIK